MRGVWPGLSRASHRNALWSVVVNARVRQALSTPRLHAGGRSARPRRSIDRRRLGGPRRRQHPSRLSRREQSRIGRLGVGLRRGQRRNAAGKNESCDQDSDHGRSIPRRPGLPCAARTALRGRFRTTCRNDRKSARVRSPGQFLDSAAHLHHVLIFRLVR
jgi:hypothetical protein